MSKINKKKQKKSKRDKSGRKIYLRYSPHAAEIRALKNEAIIPDLLDQTISNSPTKETLIYPSNTLTTQVENECLKLAKRLVEERKEESSQPGKLLENDIVFRIYMKDRTISILKRVNSDNLEKCKALSKEFQSIKEENSNLLEQNSMLIKENKSLKKKIEELEKKKNIKENVEIAKINRFSNFQKPLQVKLESASDISSKSILKPVQNNPPRKQIALGYPLIRTNQNKSEMVTSVMPYEKARVIKEQRENLPAKVPKLQESDRNLLITQNDTKVKNAWLTRAQKTW
uniref:Uncharacterized protein n=1 Tax=Acrobeloides nanus TaxID=290746 RepID=A0A914CJJ6_9BILA